MQPGETTPFGYTYGPNEYGWVVCDAEDGIGSPNSYIYDIYADMPPGYEVVTKTLNFGDTGWGGWSCPAGKVILGGGFEATGPVAVSMPGTPGLVTPWGYIYGPNEYGWIIRDAPDSASNTIKIYAICADEPLGYEVVKSSVKNYGDTGCAGWSVPNGKVVTGGGFQNQVPVKISKPGTPGLVTPWGYTYGPNEYGWIVCDAPDSAGSPNSYIYVIYASFPDCIPSNGGVETCDGVDNDCNGVVDDGINPTPTTCGVGACASTGQTTCVNGVPGDTCTPGASSTETCNGVDDDCDGTADENVCPQGIKSDALVTLQSLPGTNVDPLKKAITDITKSLNPAYWVDPSHVICKSSPGGDSLVFAPEKDAVYQLMKIKPADSRYATVRQVILNIVAVDRMLANTLYMEAKAANPSCDPLCGTSGHVACTRPCNELKASAKYLAEGDKYASSGKYKDAVDKYKNSWYHAEKIAPMCLTISPLTGQVISDTSGEGLLCKWFGWFC
jgi:hypothetical protein